MTEDWDCQKQKGERKAAFLIFAHLSKMLLILDAT